jgi:hypothetical protein
MHAAASKIKKVENKILAGLYVINIFLSHALKLLFRKLADKERE